MNKNDLAKSAPFNEPFKWKIGPIDLSRSKNENGWVCLKDWLFSTWTASSSLKFEINKISTVILNV